MKTLRLRADDPDALPQAAAILRRGGLVAFPTETVYGLGAQGLNAAAVERIFAAKGRPHSDPIILHAAETDGVRGLVREFGAAGEKLAAAFWPGPLTLVLPKSDCVPTVVTAGLDSVAVRVPAHPVALALIRKVGSPLAAPSANLFSHVSPTTAAHVLADLDGRIDAVLDAGSAQVGVESTVVDLRGETPTILRPGGISRAQLESVLRCDVAVLERCEPDDRAAGMVSPGQLTRHYSPRTPLILYTGVLPTVLEEQVRAVRDASPDQKFGVLAYTEDLPAWNGAPVELRDLGSEFRPQEAGNRLYAALRSLDSAAVTLILARTLPDGGLADAVNDRLLRAAAGKVVRVGF